jgi:hypothetical protein
MRCGKALIFWCLGCLAAYAGDPLHLVPDQFAQKRGSGFVTWSAPSGFETFTFAELPASVDEGAANRLAQGFLSKMGCQSSQKDAQAGLVVFRCSVTRTGTSIRLLAGTARAPDADGRLLTIHAAPADDASALQRQADLVPRLLAYSRGEDLQAAATPPVAPAATAPPASDGALSRVVFDLDYVGGVGGYTYPRYEPVYLFSDGRACRCAEYAAADVTAAVWSSLPPTRVGRWSEQAGTITIRYADDGTPEQVKADRAVPKAVPSPKSFKGSYQSVGGGGNVATNGPILAGSMDTLTFYPDGTFSDSTTSFASGEGGVGGAKRTTSGSFQIRDAVLELRYADGRELRTSLFYSSKRKADAQFGRLGVVWIGGRGYKRRE